MRICSVPDVNPSVEAAWIAGASGLVGVLVGVAGATIVGVVGFQSTRNATSATNATTKDVLQSQIQAARDDRVYDKRAEVYIELLAMQASLDSLRLEVRKHVEGNGPDLEKISKAAENNADWPTIGARLEAFCTGAVYEAFVRSVTANAVMSTSYESWVDDPSDAARAAALSAIEKADGVTGDVSTAVRNELIGDSTPLASWGLVPLALLLPAKDQPAS